MDAWGWIWMPLLKTPTQLSVRPDGKQAPLPKCQIKPAALLYGNSWTWNATDNPSSHRYLLTETGTFITLPRAGWAELCGRLRQHLIYWRKHFQKPCLLYFYFSVMSIGVSFWCAVWWVLELLETILLYLWFHVSYLFVCWFYWSLDMCTAWYKYDSKTRILSSSPTQLGAQGNIQKNI